MNAKDVRDTVRAWVAGVVGVTTIHAWPNANAPAEPYVVVTRTISDRVHDAPAGEAFIVTGEGDDETITQAPLADTYWRFSVDAFGPDAEDYLAKIKVASDVPTAMWPLRPLVLVDTSRILTDVEIRDQVFKDRAQMTIEVRAIVRDGLVVDVIETQEPEFTSVD